MSPPAWPRRCARRTWDASARCSPRTGGTSRRSTPACAPTRWRAWSRRLRRPACWAAKRRARAPAGRSSFWPGAAPTRSRQPPGRPAPPCSPWRGRWGACRHGDRGAARRAEGGDRRVARSHGLARAPGATRGGASRRDAGHRGAAARAGEILRAYAARYFRYPNRDNVLGPSRLFFSTYLESLWIANVLAAAVLLRESGNLDEATTRAVNQVAEEAANLIGEFDEGFSNRQTWNNAALAAIASWFEDEDLASRAIESPTGLLAHLMRGFGPDGMWYEGENYHLFALRGLLTGVAWAAQAGIDVWAEPQLARRVRAPLLAPARTALPDFSFPAREDSRFGVSPAQPMCRELWAGGDVTGECGRRGGGRGQPDRRHRTRPARGGHWWRGRGTGADVARRLFWYRSTLAHNARRRDGVPQPAGDATCEMFGDGGGGGG